MIKYGLKCANEHDFDSWFASAEAFENLLSRRLITCPVCGGEDVSKAMMAPSVRPARKATERRPLTAMANPAEKAIAEMRKHVEENSDYVGKDFARVARDIHTGDAPERSIHGEATPGEAKSLIEDGVPVAPLPFTPSRKAN